MQMFQRQQQTQDYSQHFNKFSNEVQGGPTDNRGTRDICCYVTFILIMGAFIGMGAYMINQEQDFIFNYNTYNNSSNNITSISVWSNVFSNYYQVILACFGLSLLISILYVVLLNKFPACMVYFLIIMSILSMIAMIIIAAVQGIWGLCIAGGISLALTLCFLYCYWRYIKTGILLLGVANQFLSEKKSTYFAIVWVWLLAFAFFVFYVISMLGIQNSADRNYRAGTSQSKEIGFFTYFVLVYIFMCLFFYYVYVFLISTACSFWYYGLHQNYFCKGQGWINKYHIGSFTFAAIIITIINIIKNFVQQKSNENFREGNVCAGICLCLLACCIASIEALVEMLNHNAVIIMVITGESFVDAAKSAYSLIGQNFGLFYAVQTISTVVTYGGGFIGVTVPTIVGILVARYSYQRVPTDEELVHIGLILFFLTILLVMFIVSIIGEALSCIFIYYCMDKRLASMGINVVNSPATIKHLINYGHQLGITPPSAQNF